LRVLLDTHTFLWFNSGAATLSARARRAIEDPRNEPLLSVACIWEIAIKKSLRKLELDVDLAELVQQGAIDSGIALLDVGARHALAVEALPFHHRDPFDRLLIAQALIEDVAIVTRDPEFDAYGVSRIW